MTKTPLMGKQVTIVCDEATLQQLYKMNDYQWNNFDESEFMFITELQDTELNDDQMEFYSNNDEVVCLTCAEEVLPRA